MAKATTYANDVLDQTLPNGASGTDVIGPTTYTLPAGSMATPNAPSSPVPPR